MKKYKDIILTQNYHQIKQTTHLTQREIDILFEDIKQCQPFPCQNYSNQNDIYVLGVPFGQAFRFYMVNASILNA